MKKTQEKLTATTADRFSFSLVFCLYIKVYKRLFGIFKFQEIYVNVPDSLIELLTGRYTQQRDEMLRKTFCSVVVTQKLPLLRTPKHPSHNHSSTYNSLLLCLYTRQRSSIYKHTQTLGFSLLLMR